MPKALAVLLALATGVMLLTTDAEGRPPFSQRGTVVAIVDPASLSVRITDGTTDLVRLAGVSAPQIGNCAFQQATADVTSLALGKAVWLVVIAGPNGRGRSRTVVASVILSGGLDLGLELVQRGDATVSGDQHPFRERAAYLRAQRSAQASSLGLWACSRPPAGGHGKAPAPPANPDGQGRGHSGHGPHSN